MSTWVKSKNRFYNLAYCMFVEAPEGTGRTLNEGELFLRMADGSEHRLNGPEANDIWQMLTVMAHIRRDDRHA
jgi:hypothetical protein